MNVASKKAKGRRLQQEVVELLLREFPGLTDRDIRSAPMGTNGEDIVLSEEASKRIPYSIECKNTERLNIWEALEQAESKNRTLTSVVIFKRNNSKTYACLELSDLITLIHK